MARLERQKEETHLAASSSRALLLLWLGRRKPEHRSIDQIAYRSMDAMTFWFDFYHHFAESVTYGQEGTSFRDFSGCERLPGRPEPINCPVISTSGIEC